MPNPNKIKLGPRLLIGALWALIALFAYASSQFERAFWYDDDYPQLETTFVTVTESTVVLYRNPYGKGAEDMIAILKADILYDSVQAEVKRTARRANGKYFISFRYPHWFYFYKHENLTKYNGAWVDAYWVKKKTVGTFEYLEHLRDDYTATHATFPDDNHHKY